jgi:hypothetical protein
MEGENSASPQILKADDIEQVSLRKVLLPEQDRPLEQMPLLLVFRQSDLTLQMCMQNLPLRTPTDLVTRTADPQTEIRLFLIKKKVRIESAHFFQNRPPNQQAATGQPGIVIPPQAGFERNRALSGIEPPR